MESEESASRSSYFAANQNGGIAQRLEQAAHNCLVHGSNPCTPNFRACRKTSMRRVLLIDISNSFTKIAIARGNKIGRVHRIATKLLNAAHLRKRFPRTSWDASVVASVVPEKNLQVTRAFGDAVLWVGSGIPIGIGVDYPSPKEIGADRLANAVGCREFHGVPAIVVDFGTAVTFDVISSASTYIGGVIAPGLDAMTKYLHDRTALLPLIRLREPGIVVGRSTTEAMISGAVHGYRGLVGEILRQICGEAFPCETPKVIATGGDAELIAAGVVHFDAVDPLLTLRGLLCIANRNA